MTTTRLMHYDPRWKQEFEQTRSGILQSCLGSVTAVEHIGSTAISGLIARPTIDVIAGLNPATASEPGVAQEAAKLIEGLNYRQIEAPTWAPEVVVLDKPRHGEPTHRVFLTVHGSPFWQQATALRDHLRNNPELAIRFEETKIARWRSNSGDTQRYTADKTMFLIHLIDQIGH